MSAKPNTFKIGVFTILAVVLFVAGLLAFGAKSYFVKKTKFETAIVGEVSGLAVGSEVQLRGVPIGHVTQIGFVWDVYPESKKRLIIVEFQVEGNLLPLPPGEDMATTLKEATDNGLRAVVKGQGITGTSILSLETLNPDNYPPPAIDYKPRYYYVPSAPGQFTRMLESIETSLDSFQNLDFAGINVGVTNTLNSVAQLVNKMNQTDFQSISTNATALLVEVNNLTVQLQETIQQMKLQSVSHNTDEAIRNLNDVLLQLKRYPSGFILGEPPPPAKSVQAPSK